MHFSRACVIMFYNKDENEKTGGAHVKKIGWLVVNAFLGAEKYQTLYQMLLSAARAQEIELLLKPADGLVCAFGEEAEVFAPLPDFVLFWDKDVGLARRFERLGVPVFNTARAIELCDDNRLTGEILNAHGVKIPKTIPAPKTFENVGYFKTDFLDCAERALGYPMVIKEAYGSFGAQVYLARNRAEALKIVDKIGHKEFLMQEFIAESAGRDIRVNVVDGRVVCAMLRYNETDFRSNVTNGGKTQKIVLDKAQEQIALAACKALGLHFAGVDVLFGAGGEPLVCEVNSNPHFKSSLDCTGVDLAEHILRLIAERI